MSTLLTARISPPAVVSSLPLSFSLSESRRLAQGMDLVKKIEACGSDSGKPKVAVTINDCGEL